MVSSGNSLDYTEQDMTFMTANKVAVKEMEAAAIAWVAAMFQTPMICLKSITDIVDGKELLQQIYSDLCTSTAASCLRCKSNCHALDVKALVSSIHC